MLSYQTLRICEGFAALSSDIISSIWPSNEEERGEVFYFSGLLWLRADRLVMMVQKTDSFSVFYFLLPATFLSKVCSTLSGADIFSNWFKEHSQIERCHLLFWVPGYNPILKDDPVRAPAKKSGALQGKNQGSDFHWFLFLFCLF